MRRRTLLKNIGASGATLALSGVSVTTAEGVEEHAELNIDITSILRSEQVKSILQTLGHPTPEAAHVLDSSQNSPVELQLDNIETEVVTADAGSDVTITTIPTNIGVFTAVTADSDLARVVNFEFNDDLTSREKQRIHAGSEIGWPDGTTALLVGSSSGAYFMREATDREVRRLADVVDPAVGRVSAVEADTWSGYSVQPEADAKQRGFKVSTSFEVIGRTASMTSEPSGEVVAQDCDLEIVNCLSLLFPLPTPCIGCAAACSGGQAVPAIGQAACLVCLLGTCGSFVLAYSACAGVQDCV